MIKIYTDGSCLGNPGRGGWAAIILNGDKEVELYGNTKDTTNNRMEMTAAIEALKWVRVEAGVNENSQNSPIEIHSDSNLLVQSINQNWKRKKNQDLWSELDRVRGFLNIKWVWIKGHSINKYNNRADKLAVEQAQTEQNKST